MSSYVYHRFCTGCNTPTLQKGPYCGECGKSVRRDETGDSLALQRELITAPALWHFDLSFCAAFELTVNQGALSQFLVKRAGSCWRTILSNTCLPEGVFYIDFQIDKATGGGTHVFLGFVEGPVSRSSHPSFSTSPHTVYIPHWSTNVAAPWTAVLGNDGVIYSQGDQRRLLEDATMKTPKVKVGFAVDTYSDQIGVYVNGDYKGLLTTGIRGRKLYPAVCMHYDGDAVTVFHATPKPRTLAEMELKLKAQLDEIQSLKRELEVVEKRVAELKLQNTAVEEQNLLLKKQMEIRSKLASKADANGHFVNPTTG